MKKKIIWIIAILIIAIVALVIAKKKGWIGKEEGTKVTAEKAELRTIIETVNASGKVYPEIEVKVSPDVSGEIVELTVNEGDSVVKGQILARIYADILLSQRDQVMAGVNQSRAQLANSQASIAGLKAQVDNLKVIFERQKKLLSEKVISRAEYEQAEQNLLTAAANYNAAREGIKSSEASIQSALAQLQRADKDLSRTVIVSPMSGIISLMNVKKGERVAGNSFNIGTE
ncbi:MAG: biotin/lipoyl-binding protein, partial [Chitinophagaceae bacterium]|nr:biotin/lipoyl-binding protein [Chitinophagaceae bacterium]